MIIANQKRSLFTKTKPFTDTAKMYIPVFAAWLPQFQPYLLVGAHPTCQYTETNKNTNKINRNISDYFSMYCFIFNEEKSYYNGIIILMPVPISLS